MPLGAVGVFGCVGGSHTATWCILGSQVSECSVLEVGTLITVFSKYG